MAKCPAHSDKTPSLSIRDAARGRVLIHCHAGCEQSSVIAALRQRGLWDADYWRPNLQIVGKQFDADECIARLPYGLRRRSRPPQG
jgi:hypothetical protein